MQIDNTNNIFGIQNILPVSYGNNGQTQAQPRVQQGADTVQISSEARALYEQSLALQRQESHETQSQLRDDAVAEELLATETEEQKASAEIARRFRDVLDKHLAGTETPTDGSGDTQSISGDSASGKSEGSGEGSGASGKSGGGGGGSSSSSSSADAIEDLENKISQVSAELASAAASALKTGDTSSNARVSQLQSELQQLQAQLAELQTAAAEEGSA